MLRPYVEGIVRRRRFFKCAAHSAEDFQPDIQGATVVNLVIAGEEQGTDPAHTAQTKRAMRVMTRGKKICSTRPLVAVADSSTHMNPTPLPK